MDGKVYLLENQSVIYEGGWGKDVYHGKGHLKRLNGSEYEGDFYYGKLQGQGKMTFVNGDIYIGEFRDNMREGHGEYKVTNGDYYKGEFQGNLFHGKGEYRWFETGDFFHGNFENGRMLDGKMQFGIGIQAEGNFNSNEPIRYEVQDLQTQKNLSQMISSSIHQNNSN